MLGANGGATDDQHLKAGVQSGLVVVTHAGWRECPARNHALDLDFAYAGCKQLGVNWGLVDLL